MKKFLALAACVLLFSPLAKAQQFILTIDITDISAVIFTATGENATANDVGVDSFWGGFTLLTFFTSTTNFTVSGTSTKTLQTDGMTAPYEGLAWDNYASGSGWGVDPGVDLTIFAGTGPQNFSTSSPAFTGSVIFNMSGASAVLPAINTTGDIRAGDGYPDTTGGVIGQYKVVPEPATVLLVTAAGVAIFTARRRR